MNFLALVFSLLCLAVSPNVAAQNEGVTAPPTFDPAITEGHPVQDEIEWLASRIGSAIAELRSSWNTEVTQQSERTFLFSFRMWPLRAGGSGEGMLQLKRRAELMKRDLGFSRYQISEYQEGLETNFPFTQRFITAVVEFEGKPGENR